MKNNLSSVSNPSSVAVSTLLNNISGHELISAIGIVGMVIFGGIFVVCATGSELSVENGAISLRGRTQV